MADLADNLKIYNENLSAHPKVSQFKKFELLKRIKKTVSDFANLTGLNISFRIGEYNPIQSQNGGKIMDSLALFLSIVGCLNWGLVGIFQFDLVAWLFGGQDATWSRIVYTLVGLCGLWCISLLFRKREAISEEN